MPISDRLIWTDLETFGLSDHHPIIEYAFIITDLELNLIDDHTATIWTTPEYDVLYSTLHHGTREQKYVYQMHEASGLWDEARSVGVPPFTAEIDMNDWLESHGVRGGEEPLCGNSVHQDRVWLRRQYRSVNDRFHYRNVDVSTLKELCNIYDPEVAALKPTKGLDHRALPDLHETIAEFEYYKGRFFRDTLFEDNFR